MRPRQACQGKAEAAPRAWILKGALDRLERRYAEIRAPRNFCEKPIFGPLTPVSQRSTSPETFDVRDCATVSAPFDTALGSRRPLPGRALGYRICVRGRPLYRRVQFSSKVGRPPHHVRRCHASFSYQAGSWSKPRRVIAKVEWHPEELYPRVGFIVTNMSRPAERVVAFYNKRGTCEQWIKEGKGAIK